MTTVRVFEESELRHANDISRSKAFPIECAASGDNEGVVSLRIRRRRSGNSSKVDIVRRAIRSPRALSAVARTRSGCRKMLNVSCFFVESSSGMYKRCDSAERR